MLRSKHFAPDELEPRVRMMVDSLFVLAFVQIVGFYRLQVKRFTFMA